MRGYYHHHGEHGWLPLLIILLLLLKSGTLYEPMVLLGISIAVLMVVKINIDVIVCWLSIPEFYAVVMLTAALYVCFFKRIYKTDNKELDAGKTLQEIVWQSFLLFISIIICGAILYAYDFRENLDFNTYLKLLFKRLI